MSETEPVPTSKPKTNPYMPPESLVRDPGYSPTEVPLEPNFSSIIQGDGSSSNPSLDRLP